MIQHTEFNQASNGHILLAEDDQIGRIVITRMLAQAAYTVDVVGDGLEAIKALELIDYDLVVMDCSMPVMDGFTATRIIRKTGSTAINPDVPVIAVTALTMKGDRERCVDAGMNDYVSKPVDFNMLIAAIERCLGRACDEEVSSQQKEMQQEQAWENGFLDTIIDKFLAEVPQVVAALERALERGDVVGLKDIGHRLRGSAELLRATTLSARSYALEQTAQIGDLVLVTRLTSELIQELQALTVSLAEA